MSDNLAEKQEPTFRQIVRDALADRDGNVTKTINYLISQLRQNKSLLERLVTEIVREAVAETVMERHRKLNQNLVRRVATVADGRSAVIALARGLSNTMADWRLRGGKKVRDAERSEISEQIGIFDRSIGDMQRKARWLQLIAQAVPDGKIVSAVLSDARIDELWKESENA